MIEYIAIAVVVVVLLVVLVLALKRKRTVSGSGARARSPKAAPGDTPVNRQLYVGNVSYRASEGAIREFFAEYGPVETVRVIKDRRTGRSKGFAFVTFSDLSGASAALAAHEQELNGRALIVRYAKPNGK